MGNDATFGGITPSGSSGAKSTTRSPPRSTTRGSRCATRRSRATRAWRPRDTSLVSTPESTSSGACYKAPANKVIRAISSIAEDVNKRAHDMLNPKNINVLRFLGLPFAEPLTTTQCTIGEHRPSR